MNLENINKEIFYREEKLKELQNKGLPNWSGKDSEDYISTQQELEYLRNEQKILRKRGD